MFHFHLAKTTPSILRRCASFFECFCWLPLRQIFQHLRRGDTNLSLAKFLAVLCIARGHRKLLAVISFFRTSQANRESMGKPLSKVAQNKAHDVAKADWPYFHM